MKVYCVYLVDTGEDSMLFKIFDSKKKQNNGQMTFLGKTKMIVGLM